MEKEDTLNFENLQRDKEKRRNINSFIFIKRNIIKIWKYKYRLLIIFILYNILFNPSETAYIFSQWVNDFIGTIIKSIDL